MNKKKKVLIMFILISISFSLAIISFGRYTSSYMKGYYLKSKGFYFESNELKTNKNNTNLLWDGGSTTFTLKNYASENLITDFDIRYTVTCEVLTENINASCTINDSNNSTLNLVLSSNARCVNEKDETDVTSYNKTECEVDGYNWLKQKVSQNNYFNIVFNNQNDQDKEIDVRITATSTSPYSKSLSGVFKLQRNIKSSGEITNINKVYSNFSELILNNTYSQNKCLQITFDSTNRVLDINNLTTNLQYDANDYVNGFKTIVNADSSSKIKFFKRSNNSDLSLNDFVIRESSGCN